MLHVHAAKPSIILMLPMTRAQTAMGLHSCRSTTGTAAARDQRLAACSTCFSGYRCR